MFSGEAEPSPHSRFTFDYTPTVQGAIESVTQPVCAALPPYRAVRFYLTGAHFPRFSRLRRRFTRKSPVGEARNRGVASNQGASSPVRQSLAARLGGKAAGESHTFNYTRK